MPYASRAQQGLFHAKMERGEMSPEMVHHWDEASKGQHNLPYHVKKKDQKHHEKKAFWRGFLKQAACVE